MKRQEFAHILPIVGLVLVLLMAPLSVQAAPPVPPSGDGDAPPTVAAPPIEGTPTTVRAAYGLRLREGPSLSDRIILVMRNGETVYPAGGPVWRQGIPWIFVRVRRWGYTYEGFCASNYLANYGGGVPSGESGVKVVAGAGLRLRSGPGLGYYTRRIVPYGTVLRPTGATRWGSGLQWTQVSVDGVYLWAASKYLVKV
ncbi:MAG: SH3 domain-containing protein [Anaerolineae bacterium]